MFSFQNSVCQKSLKDRSMNKFNLSSYSETDSYDSESDNHVRSGRQLINFFNTKNLPRYEFKIEISELLAKFAEYSRLGTMFACKYINHPITSGIIIYIPYHRLTKKCHEGSLLIDSESDWETYESINEEKYEPVPSKEKAKSVIPTKSVYLQRGKSKNDVSYARMVKKPHIPNMFHYKEEMWGQRYPNKRYIMNNSIQNHIYKILNVISERCTNEFLENDFNLSTSGEICKKIQVDLQRIRQNSQKSNYENFQLVLNEFGKLFYSSRLICMNHPHLLNKISYLEIEFENQLEIHFGEWNTK